MTELLCTYFCAGHSLHLSTSQCHASTMRMRMPVPMYACVHGSHRWRATSASRRLHVLLWSRARRRAAILPPTPRSAAPTRWTQTSVDARSGTQCTHTHRVDVCATAMLASHTQSAKRCSEIDIGDTVRHTDTLAHRAAPCLTRLPCALCVLTYASALFHGRTYGTRCVLPDIEETPDARCAEPANLELCS